MKSLAIITARGGSKRIPRKNIRPFCGQPIITYPIHAAIESTCFDEVMVSTEDGEIAEVARAAGASVPFFRSMQNADDFASTEAVVQEVLDEYRKLGRLFELVCCIYPVAALVTAERLRQGRDLLLANAALGGVVTVVRFGFPIQRALEIKGGQLAMIQPENLEKRSQDLQPTYHDAGQFYWLRVPAFLTSGSLFGPPVAPLVLSEMEAQDIDDEGDWCLAEQKHAFRKQKGP